MKKIELALQKPGEQHRENLCIDVNRMVNAGYVGRDTAAVKAHIEELAKEGVPEPASVPMVFPVSARNLTTENRIQVVGGDTSGEVEYVLILNNGKVYVGVGSDHTDRRVETGSIVKSKQVCQNVMSATVWDLDMVKDRWDELILECRVKPGPDSEPVIYQKSFCKTIISPADLISLVRSRMTDQQTRGLVIYSGTIPFIPDDMIYAASYRCALIDPQSGSELTCEYEVEELTFLGAV